MPSARGNTFLEFLGSKEGRGTLLECWERVGRVKLPKCTPSALSKEDAADRALPDFNLWWEIYGWFLGRIRIFHKQWDEPGRHGQLWRFLDNFWNLEYQRELDRCTGKPMGHPVYPDLQFLWHFIGHFGSVFGRWRWRSMQVVQGMAAHGLLSESVIEISATALTPPTTLRKSAMKVWRNCEQHCNAIAPHCYG